MDGQEVIDYVKELTLKQIKEANYFPICPIRALVLDYSMPKKTGLDVVIELQLFFKKIINEHD